MKNKAYKCFCPAFDRAKAWWCHSVHCSVWPLVHFSLINNISTTTGQIAMTFQWIFLAASNSLTCRITLPTTHIKSHPWSIPSFMTRYLEKWWPDGSQKTTHYVLVVVSVVLSSGQISQNAVKKCFHSDLSDPLTFPFVPVSHLNWYLHPACIDIYTTVWLP